MQSASDYDTIIVSQSTRLFGGYGREFNKKTKLGHQMSPFTKFMLYLSIVLALVIGSIWFIGGKAEEFEAQTTIDARTKVVFDYIVKPQHRVRWVDNLKQCRLDDSEMNVGTEYDSVYQFNDSQQQTLKERILNWDDGKYLVVRRDQSDMRVNSIFRLEPIGRNTRIAITRQESPQGLARLWAPFLRSTGKDIIERELLELKRLVETTAVTGVFDDDESDEDD
jgi:uncharacterized protein YndB with AHSA1/START domain